MAPPHLTSSGSSASFQLSWILLFFLLLLLFFFCSLGMHCACPGFAHTPFSRYSLQWRNKIPTMLKAYLKHQVFPSREKARSHWNWQRHRCLPFTGYSLTYMRHWESTTESRNQLLSGCPMSPHLPEPRASSPTSNLLLFFLSLLLSPASILLYNLEYVPLPLQLRTSHGLDSVLATVASPAPGRVGSQ